MKDSADPYGSIGGKTNGKFKQLKITIPVDLCKLLAERVPLTATFKAER